MTELLRGVATTVKSSGVAMVKVGAQVVPAFVDQDKTLAVGDPVVLGLVGSAYYVMGRYFTAVGSTDQTGIPEPPPVPVVTMGSNTFLPTMTGSWRDKFGGWRDDVDSLIQGEFGGQGNHIGCAFYGTQVHTLAGATVVSASIKAHRLSGGTFAAQQTTLGHITEASKPSGAPTFGGSFIGPNMIVEHFDGHIVIDTSLVQSLVDGTYGGLGIHIAGSAPYVVMAGLSDYAGSFALTINWRK